jgi:cytidylate kinase
VPSLILLNGPPAVGKSTLARTYAIVIGPLTLEAAKAYRALAARLR